MVRSALIAGLLAVFLAGPATAETGRPGLTVSSADTITPLVELYTSEGCSSCPRADRYLTSLGDALDEEFQAVPLAFHVDYWNWLGWKDPFSKAQYTDRQRLIAEYNRQRSIYTPELVVAGREARGGKGVVEIYRPATSRGRRYPSMSACRQRAARAWMPIFPSTICWIK